MRDQNAAIKCQFLLAVNNFESNYILFKLPILFQRPKRFTLRNAELDIVDFNCNKEYSIRQLELNTSELNYYAIKVKFIEKPKYLFHPSEITILLVGSVVEWLKHQTDDQRGLGSKPTCAILLCPWERLFYSKKFKMLLYTVNCP